MGECVRERLREVRVAILCSGEVNHMTLYDNDGVTLVRIRHARTIRIAKLGRMAYILDFGLYTILLQELCKLMRIRCTQTFDFFWRNALGVVPKLLTVPLNQAI